MLFIQSVIPERAENLRAEGRGCQGEVRRKSNPSEAVKKLKIAKFRFCRSLTTKGRIFIFVRKINFFTASQSRRVGTPQRAVPTFTDPLSLTGYKEKG
jgi:hypothetical protein